MARAIAQAHELLDTALASYRELGMEAHAASALALARRVGTIA
jgi:hypothetical protein